MKIYSMKMNWQDLNLKYHQTNRFDVKKFTNHLHVNFMVREQIIHRYKFFRKYKIANNRQPSTILPSSPTCYKLMERIWLSFDYWFSSHLKFRYFENFLYIFSQHFKLVFCLFVLNTQSRAENRTQRDGEWIYVEVYW